MNDLERLYEAIKAVFIAALPPGVEVDYSPDLENGFALPTVIFAMTEWVPGPDPGTGQTSIIGRFQAVVMTDSTESQASLKAAWLALQVTSALSYQTWGLDYVEHVSEIRGALDENPAIDGAEVCGVQWQQVVRLGGVSDWSFPPVVSKPFGLVPL